MKIQDLRLHKLNDNEPIPFELLLIADEEEGAIRKYIYDAVTYTIYNNEELNPIGVFVLYKINESVLEIKNIGILESFRSRGIGSFLIDSIKKIAQKENYKEIIVGTADCGIKQIWFYEKNGFVKYAVKKNFFIENYSQPLFEDGIMLRDMVMLKISLERSL
jgi:ribosomal protein S18 acetylase RimI-like enzyme